MDQAASDNMFPALHGDSPPPVFLLDNPGRPPPPAPVLLSVDPYAASAAPLAALVDKDATGGKRCAICKLLLSKAKKCGQYYGMPSCNCSSKTDEAKCCHTVVCYSHAERFKNEMRRRDMDPSREVVQAHSFCAAKNKCMACRNKNVDDCLAVGMTKESAMEAQPGVGPECDGTPSPEGKKTKRRRTRSKETGMVGLPLSTSSSSSLPSSASFPASSGFFVSSSGVVQPTMGHHVGNPGWLAATTVGAHAHTHSAPLYHQLQHAELPELLTDTELPKLYEPHDPGISLNEFLDEHNGPLPIPLTGVTGVKRKEPDADADELAMREFGHIPDAELLFMKPSGHL